MFKESIKQLNSNLLNTDFILLENPKVIEKRGLVTKLKFKQKDNELKVLFGNKKLILENEVEIPNDI